VLSRDEVALVQPKSKVELYAAIRRDSRAGLSIRAIQSKYDVGFRTVEKALASVWPAPRKPLPPRPSRLDPFKPLIDQMLRVDLDASPKQRHTAKRIFDRLVEEHGAVEVSYGMVRDDDAITPKAAMEVLQPVIAPLQDLQSRTGKPSPS
jgi:transposase